MIKRWQPLKNEPQLQRIKTILIKLFGLSLAHFYSVTYLLHVALYNLPRGLRASLRDTLNKALAVYTHKYH